MVHGMNTKTLIWGGKVKDRNVKTPRQEEKGEKGEKRYDWQKACQTLSANTAAVGFAAACTR